MNTTHLPNKQTLVEDQNYQYVAWAMIMLSPIFFFIGFAAAHIPYIFWDYKEGSGTEPFWFSLLTVVCFLAVQAFPVWVMWRYGHLAEQAGHKSGFYAYWAGAFWGFGLLALMVFTLMLEQM
jgi:hypothetical protein